METIIAFSAKAIILISIKKLIKKVIKNMDISQLKNTSDLQFEKNLDFNAVMPDESTPEGFVTDIVLTVKSARNPKIKSKLNRLIMDIEKEREKLNRPKINDADYESTVKTIGEKEKELAKLMLVKFSGLESDGKPYPCTKGTMEKLVDEHSWIRDNIVSKATSQAAFYTV